MTRRLLLLTAACAVALLAAGCGEEGEGGNGRAPKISDAPELEGTVDYTRSGGLAGRIHRLTIQPGGSAVLATERIGTQRITLRPQDLAAVREEIAAADLAAAPADTRAPEPVPDAYRYTVGYRGQTVAADQTVAPEEVRPLFATLSAIVDRYFKP